MIGKILGAVIGSKAAASHAGGLGGTGGALMGAGAAALLRRMGPVGLVAAVVGGYALKRYSDKRDARTAGHPAAGPRTA